jgi:hypothetical protein
MAEQIPDTTITGNVGNFVLYKMDGADYVRRKSSLTRKQFTIQSRFAKAAKVLTVLAWEASLPVKDTELYPQKPEIIVYAVH